MGAVSVVDAVVFGKDLMNKHVFEFPGLTIGSNLIKLKLKVFKTNLLSQSQRPLSLSTLLVLNKPKGL